MAVPSGYMFTEGKQSSSSVIAWRSLTPPPVPSERPTCGICDLWSDVTGCTDHEIVVSVSEVV